MKIENKQINRTLGYGLTAFGLILALNAFLIRYPAEVSLHFLAAAGLAAAVFVYGFAFLVMFGRKETTVIEACAVGLMITTGYFFVFAYLKLLIPAVIFAYYLLPLPLLFFSMKKARPLLSETLRGFFHRPAREYFIFLLPLVYAALPSSFYDTLVYHLGIPNLYLQNGGFIPTAQFLYSNTGIYYEISLIPAVFAGDFVPRFFHFFLGMLFGLSLADFAVQWLGLKERFHLLLLMISMPVSIFLLATVKNDLLSAIFILAAIQAYLQNRHTFSALNWGFALGVKYFNALALALFVVAVVIKERRLDVKRVFILGLVVAGVMLPLFIKNYQFVGNPVYPFFHDRFDSPYFDDSRMAVMKRDVGKAVRDFRSLVEFPYALSFRELGSGGITGVQFLVFLPFLLIIKRPKHLFLLGFSLLFLFVGAGFTVSIRFMFIALSFLAVFTVLVYQTLELKIARYLFIFFIGVNFATSFGCIERIYRGFNLYSGKLNIEEYKAHMFPSYPAIAFVNQNTPPDAKVLMVGEARNFYLKRQYETASALDYCILRKYLAAGPEYGDFIAALKKDGFHYIVTNRREFHRLQRTRKRLTEAELEKTNRFLSFLKPVFKEGDLYVFKIE